MFSTFFGKKQTGGTTQQTSTGQYLPSNTQQQLNQNILQQANQNQILGQQWASTGFSPNQTISLASVLEEERKVEEEAKKEILTFEPLTQQILDLIRDGSSVMIVHRIYSCLADLGREIDKKVKTTAFNKKLEDIIND